MDFSLLEKYQIAVVPYKVASSKSEVIDCADELGYPIALKLISKKAIHKTEQQALALNLKNSSSAQMEFTRLKKIDKDAKILVQKFMPSSLELIVGAKLDEQFGPVVLLGLGGIYAEIFSDVQMRVCPPSDRQIRSMISNLNSFKILKGARSQRGVNLFELSMILRRVSNLALAQKIKEIDINPLILTPKGLMAADVRVIR